MAKKQITVEGIEIGITRRNQDEYLSLTDIAQKFGEPRIIIQNWMRARNTIQFLGVWETMHNPGFNRVEFDAFLFEAGGNAFTMSPSKWIESTGAIGMVSKPGRYGGGTFAHKDLAFGFGYWLNPAFQLYLIKEFQRLKEKEAEESNLQLDWNLRRTLSKINYAVHADAVRHHLVPPLLQNTRQEGLYHATEADLLNLALFGVTAKQWREANPDLRGNLRDHATAEQLLVLANLENLNAEFIKQGLDKQARLLRLNEIAIHQLQLLLDVPGARLLGAGQPRLPYPSSPE
ncbi:MAG: KilA-N domain-containing protein [Saprospiraceae bacterium]